LAQAILAQAILAQAILAQGGDQALIEHGSMPAPGRSCIVAAMMADA